MLFLLRTRRADGWQREKKDARGEGEEEGAREAEKEESARGEGACLLMSSFAGDDPLVSTQRRNNSIT